MKYQPCIIILVRQGPPPESLESVASRAEWMKLSEVDVNRWSKFLSFL